MPSGAVAKIACLLNPSAGSCDAATASATIARIAGEHSVEPKVIVPEPGSGIGDLARQAIDAGAEIVVAGGGDGTINAVAAAVAGTDAALGVLPLGTLNHFAKDLGIPLELEPAVRNIFTGRRSAIDVGEVNGQLFLNNSSLGLYPMIVRQREARQKRGLPKWLALVPALTYVARHHRSVYLRLRLDGDRAEQHKTPFIFIGNNAYKTAGLDIGKRATLNGGRLWICRAPDVAATGLLRVTLRALMGRLKDRDLAAGGALEAWIDPRLAECDVALDGEVRRMQTPLRYRCRPGGLNVILPQQPTVD